MDEDLGAEEMEVRAVQPLPARKPYLCPGCNQDITRGTGHLVVVPRAAPSSAGTGTTRAGPTAAPAARAAADP